MDIDLAETTAISPAAVPIPSRLEQYVTERLEQASLWLQESSLPPADGDRLPHACPQLSVVIPVFNEFRTIATVIERVRALPIDKQIIVVDDGSTDGTRAILESFQGLDGLLVVLHPANQGKGAALQSGFRIATGEVVIVQDADLEYDPQDILCVIAPILEGRTDVVYGSRYLNDSRQDPSWIHRFGNRLLTEFSNWMTRNRLTDMETCYKAVRRSVLQSICIEQQRFGFEPEITAKLARQGHCILEVPIRYHCRSWKEGKKIGVKDLINTVWCIIRYRFG